MIENVVRLLGATLLCLAPVLAQAQGVAAPLVPAGSSAASSASRAKLAAILWPQDSRCLPNYPAAAIRAHAEGNTKLTFRIDGDGLVQAVEITGRSGSTAYHQLLDQVALQTLVRCPFKPGLDADGNPTTTTITLTYVWRVE